MTRAEIFHYDGYTIDTVAGRVTCRYRLDDLAFTEEFTLPPGPGAGEGEREGTAEGAAEGAGAPDAQPRQDWSRPGVDAAARLLFLLTGISYYKAGAPPVIDLGETAVTDGEREFLRTYYLDGLGEYAYRNGLDLSGLRIEGPRLEHPLRAGYSPAYSPTHSPAHSP